MKRCLNKLIKEFEQQHPDISVADLLDYSKPLPGNSKFAQFWNKFKQDLITIEQTSGCLIRIDYDQASDKESLSILPQCASMRSI